MTGRPYRVLHGRCESADVGALSLTDDTALFSLLLQHPDWLGSDFVFVSDGRVLSYSDLGTRTVVGWHRSGGPIILSATTGTTRAELLVEAAQLAEATAEWPVDRWNDAIAAFWRSAPRDLKERVARRWELSSEPWRLEAWTRAAWGREPLEGRARVGVIGAVVPDSVRRTVDWLAAGGREVAAFDVQRLESGGAVTYLASAVAGNWSRMSTTGSDAAEEALLLRRDLYVHHTGGVTASLLARIEQRASELGSRIAWSGEDWVRFDGARNALRVFPGTAWVDLQLVGADEGTIKGLAYRFDIPARLTAPEDAPPEVHFRLAHEDDFTPGVALLLGEWLGDEGEQDEGEDEAGGPAQPLKLLHVQPGGPPDR